MHGKIVRYLNSNGKGVVINASKMLFEFTKNTWHDAKVVPSIGMLVEFYAEGHIITSCRASKFQEFGQNTFVREADFWRSDTDEQLETLQSGMRDSITQKIFKSTDYDTIENIAVSVSIQDAIKRYFYQEFLAICYLNDLKIDDDSLLLDYVILKRFLNKSLDNLLFNDKTIMKDEFAEELAVIVRLETSYNNFIRYQRYNLKVIFNEYFLMQQCHYQALIAAIDNDKEVLALAKRQLNGTSSELLLIQRRIDTKNGNPEQLNERKEKVTKQRELAKQNLEKSQARVERLEGLRDKFYQHYFDLFVNTFETTHEMLFKKVKNGLDVCATFLDDRIWHKSLASVALKNYYFKREDSTHSFCAVGFAEQYLSCLNKSHLNDTDNVLNKYCSNIRKEQEKVFLIVSSDENFTVDLKLQIFALNKYYQVKNAHKQINYVSLLREQAFDVIYVDPKAIWKSLDEIILEGKSFKLNSEAKFIVVQKNDQVDRFGFKV